MGGPEQAHVEDAIEANTPALLAFFLRRAEVPEDAADLLSDTLLVVWRRRAAVPSESVEARMWMFGVARKVLLTQRRSSRRRSALHERLRAEVAHATRADDGTTDLSEVWEALLQLDHLDQEIIRLTYWDGFTLAEAARLLRAPEGTIRSRHHRARAELKRILNSAPVSLPLER